MPAGSLSGTETLFIRTVEACGPPLTDADVDVLRAELLAVQDALRRGDDEAVEAALIRLGVDGDLRFIAMLAGLLAAREHASRHTSGRPNPS